MKLPFFILTSLLFSASGFAITQEAAHEHWRKLPIHHKSCGLLVSKTLSEDYRRILSEKGYKIQSFEDVVKPLKKGLGLAGKAARARAEEKHRIKNCELIKDNLTLGFESGWINSDIGFNVSKILQYKQDISCAERLGSLSEEDQEVLREVAHKYDKKKEAREDYTEEENIQALHQHTLMSAIVDIPKCQVVTPDSSIVTVDPNDYIDMLPPPPVTEPLSVDDQERLQTKELNLREAERIERLLRANGRSR